MEVKFSEFARKILRDVCTSEEQYNLLRIHSEAVARKALNVAREAGLEDKLDLRFIADTALLHDVGVTQTNAPSIFCHGTEPYIRHGVLGRDILNGYGLEEKYGLVCERHTGSGITRLEIEHTPLPLPPRDMLPLSLEEKLICYADKFFSKSREPEREKTIEEVERSLEKFGPDSLERFRSMHALFTLGPG